MRAINPDHFTLMDSIWYVGMVIVGGMGSTAGAVFGTVSLRLLREVVMTISPMIGKALPMLAANILAALGPMLFGLVIILFLIFLSRAVWRIDGRYSRRPTGCIPLRTDFSHGKTRKSTEAVM